MAGERPFHDRAYEFERLQRRWETGEAQIFTLWGRRRVGKSLLLLRFARGKRHVYFEATSGTAADQLVERAVPVTVTNPERSKQSLYRIADPYLRFWFRFVLPSQDRLIDAEGAQRHLIKRVIPQLDEFVSSPAFEEVCQQWLGHELDAAATGRWWGKAREMRGRDLRDTDRELDVVAVDDDGRVIALGSCKWTAGVLPHSEKAKLDTLATYLLPDADPPDLYFFARNGFARRLAAEAERDPRIHLIAPSDLV